MKKSILLLAPILMAYACSEEPGTGTRAADRGATSSDSANYGKASDSTSKEKASATSAPAADNTKLNARDRDGDTLTPTDQKENETDLALTQKVRQAIVADDTLSMAADNIKIISLNGTVTLRGPVKDLTEKNTIESKAKAIAGVAKVDNQLEVKGP